MILIFFKFFKLKGEFCEQHGQQNNRSEYQYVRMKNCKKAKQQKTTNNSKNNMEQQQTTGL
jgi:hypothetical protein